MRNKKLLDSFVAYCNEHPQERFWQALRNWCGWPFVCVTDNSPANPDGDLIDTFYWEDNEPPELAQYEN